MNESDSSILMTFDLVFHEWCKAPVLIEYGLVPWDTEIFGTNFYEVRLPPDSRGFGEPMAHLLQFLVKEGDGDCLVFVKVRGDDVSALAELCGGGFYPVETIVEPYRKLKSFGLERRFERLVLREAEERDAAMLLQISENAFAADRYHLDPNIPDSGASLRYRSWVSNSLESADLAFVYEDSRDSTIIGFMLLRDCGNETVDLSLAAISPRHQKAGFGVLLYGEALEECRRRGFATAVTRISTNNTGVLNIYAHYGFMFRHPRMTLHYCPRPLSDHD
jgi:ribosomal protein S18 acetylase RimI-like enzyme